MGRPVEQTQDTRKGSIPEQHDRQSGLSPVVRLRRERRERRPRERAGHADEHLDPHEPHPIERMLHLRLIIPPALARPVTERLLDAPGVAHVIHLPGAALDPPGDVVLCDVAREAANETIEWLQRQGVHRSGSIAIEDVGTMVSDAAARAESMAPGHGTDALVWETIEAQARVDAGLTASFVLFMALASAIGAVGILVDSPVLIIGAMVVGPDYGPLAAICVAALRRRASAARRAARTLGIGAAAGVLASGVVALAARASGTASGSYGAADRELTAFIAQPDALAVVVAVLAGVAGMLSLTQGRPGVMIGVLVSVTTIPAIANIGVAAAYGAWTDVTGSALQLAVNLVGLLLAGVSTLWLQQRLTRSSPTGDGPP